MADYANDAAALMDLVGDEPIRVIGVSFGGMVAPELAIRYPEKIRALVLACTSSGGIGQPSYPLHELEALPAQSVLNAICRYRITGALTSGLRKIQNSGSS